MMLLYQAWAGFFVRYGPEACDFILIGYEEVKCDFDVYLIIIKLRRKIE